MTKIQITTLILLAMYLIWEVVVQIWARNEEGPIIRADLILVYPILLIFIIISIFQKFRKRN